MDENKESDNQRMVQKQEQKIAIIEETLIICSFPVWPLHTFWTNILPYFTFKSIYSCKYQSFPFLYGAQHWNNQLSHRGILPNVLARLQNDFLIFVIRYVVHVSVSHYLYKFVCESSGKQISIQFYPGSEVRNNALLTTFNPD